MNKPSPVQSKPAAKSAAKTPKPATKTAAKATPKPPKPIKKKGLYEHKGHCVAGGDKRQVRVTEVKEGKIWYEPVNYTRSRPGKGRPVGEATFRRDYQAVAEPKKAAS